MRRLSTLLEVVRILVGLLSFRELKVLITRPPPFPNTPVIRTLRIERIPYIVTYIPQPIPYIQIRQLEKNVNLN